MPIPDHPGLLYLRAMTAQTWVLLAFGLAILILCIAMWRGGKARRDASGADGGSSHGGWFGGDSDGGGGDGGGGD